MHAGDLSYACCMHRPVNATTRWPCTVLRSKGSQICTKQGSVIPSSRADKQAAAAGVKGLEKGGQTGTEQLQVRWSLGNGGAVEDGEANHPHDSSNHSSSGASHGDSASHMYLDLRPFMDQAPTTVRSGTLPVDPFPETEALVCLRRPSAQASLCCARTPRLWWCKPALEDTVLPEL